MKIGSIVAVVSILVGLGGCGSPDSVTRDAPERITSEEMRSQCILNGSVVVVLDFDGDMWGTDFCMEAGQPVPGEAQGKGRVVLNGDCDDTNRDAHPWAKDSCGSGVDEDCDGQTDAADQGGCIQTMIRCVSDHDVDGYGAGTMFSADQDCNDAGEASASLGDDCNDLVATTNPGASDLTVDGTDQNCDNIDGSKSNSKWYQDSDGDTYGNPNVSLTQANQPAGYVANNLDCLDTNASVRPGGSDLTVDGLDQNCDATDGPVNNSKWYQDSDGDTYGNPNVSVTQANAPAGYVANNTDCNDAVTATHPGAVEACNGVDDNCNNVTDENCSNNTYTFWKDVDVDGYGSLSNPTTVTVPVAPVGYVNNSTDCDDTKATVHPTAAEIVGNEIDEDCNGAEICYLDADDDGSRPSSNATYGSSDVTCVGQFEAKATDTIDCNDANAAVRPGATELVGDLLDSNCDGFEQCYVDGDDDGYRVIGTQLPAVLSTDITCTAQAYLASAAMPATDCNDALRLVNPGALDTCNGIDDNCDGTVDNGATGLNTYYRDADLDMYGTTLTTTTGCVTPAGYVTQSGDCNDAVAAVHPTVSETCDQIDNNCDGQVDEGNVCPATICPANQSVVVAKFTAPTGSVIDVTKIWGWELGQAPEIGSMPHPVTQFTNGTPSGVQVVTSAGSGSSTNNVVTVTYNTCVPDNNWWQMSVGYRTANGVNTTDCVGYSTTFTGTWFVTKDGGSVPVTTETNWSGSGCEAGW